MAAALQDVRAQLGAARDTLKSLQDDLPRYQRLLADNRQAEEAAKQAYREKQGGFEVVTTTATAVLTAQELLEQHQDDLVAARAEVTELEAVQAREVLLERAGAYALALRDRRGRYEAEFDALRVDTRKHLEALAQHYAAWLEEEAAAGEVLKALGADFSSWPSDDKRRQTQTLLGELKERNVDTEALTTWAYSRPLQGRGSWFTTEHTFDLTPNSTGAATLQQRLDMLFQSCLETFKGYQPELLGQERPKVFVNSAPNPTPAMRRLLEDIEKVQGGA